MSLNLFVGVGAVKINTYIFRKQMKKNKIILITGITGQDGAYLSKLLLNKGCEVIGFVRDRDDFSKLEYLGLKEKIQFIKCDLLNLSDVTKHIENINPDQIYNFAAQSSVSLSVQIPLQTIQFNILSVVNLLEGIRSVNKKIKLFNASSCEMFGQAKKIPSDELTPFNPLNPYAISKVSAHQIVENYRKLYGLFVCSGILFHHESHLRGEEFFIKKIIKQSVEINLGKREYLKVGNVNVSRDLGYAPAYVEAMWLMLQQEKPDDFVIASGKSILLRDIIYYVFDKLNINKNKLVVDQSLFRVADIEQTCGDNSKAKKVLGWKYNLSFYDVLDLLIEEELRNANLCVLKSHVIKTIS